MDGHNEALLGGAEKGKKYLLNFSERNNSIPNAVKFFLYDLLAEDAYRCDDLDACRTALDRASDYLPAARAETLALCDEAIALGLGNVYAAKRASIERMM